MEDPFLVYPLAFLLIHLAFPGFRFSVLLQILSYSAKKSFEIAKSMAKHMQWQNMKINKIMQKHKDKKPTSLEYLHQKEGGREAAAPLLVQILA